MDEDNIYTTEDVDVLRRAFQTACNALRFALDFDPDSKRSAQLRHEVAHHVLAIVRSGERRPLKVAQLVLAKMPPLQAHWSGVENSVPDAQPVSRDTASHEAAQLK